jgi:anaerobic selenocysteine-containing dehydrogenase
MVKPRAGDGLQRLRHAMRYSRQHSTICVSLVDAGWNAAVGQKRGVDGREIAKSDLIVVWGGNPASTQVNLMAHIAEARRERGARLVVIDPYRTATAEIADLHLAPLPGTDGALACAVMHVLFKESYADAPISRATPTTPLAWNRISKIVRRHGLRGSLAFLRGRSSISRDFMA